MKKVELEENRVFRWLEVSLYISFIIKIILLAIVIYFIGEQAYLERNKYDVNRDGVVDITDLLEKNDEVLAIRDYILEH